MSDAHPLNRAAIRCLWTASMRVSRLTAPVIARAVRPQSGAGRGQHRDDEERTGVPRFRELTATMEPNRPMTLHVACDHVGRWAVRTDTDAHPLSLHGSATEAEQAALALATAGAEVVVVVHDRYGRIRQSTQRGRFAR